MFNPVTLAFTALTGIILVLVAEELFELPQYSWPAIGAASIVGIVALRALQRTPRLAWAIACALVAIVTAVVRIGVVEGGLVTYLHGLDAFNLFGFDIWSYLLFLPSGALAGYALHRYGPQNVFLQFICLAFVSFGVLFHLIVAQGWQSSEFLSGALLFLIEFCAPAAFGVVAGIYLRRIFSSYPDTAFTQRRKRVPRNWDNLPSMVMMPMPERFTYAPLVALVRSQAPDKKLVCFLELGSTPSPGDIQRLYEFSDDPKLVLMKFPGDTRIIVRASFMYETSQVISSTTLQELAAALSREAKSRGLLSTNAR